jgi:hypothetical protein
MSLAVEEDDVEDDNELDVEEDLEDVGDALPNMKHKHAEEMRDGMLWHCDM